MKLDILAFAAHPDDVELSCSGTLLKHIKLGYKVGICDLTRGELGSRGTAETRDEEAKESSKILGIHLRENLQLADGFFQNNKDHQLKVIEVIRKYKPSIVLANAKSDRHPDHGKAAKLVADSCFLSGLVKVKTEWEGQEQEHWRPEHVYHYLQDYWHDPDFVVDVTNEWETRMKSVLAFKTQFYNPEDTSEPTPISTPEFLKHIEGRALQLGRLIGTTYGEGFTTDKALAVDNIMTLE